MENKPKMKSGIKSTEFYLSLVAIIVGAIASSGMLEGSESGTKIVGLVTAALVALGYTGSRLTLKKRDQADVGTVVDNNNGSTGTTGS